MSDPKLFSVLFVPGADCELTATFDQSTDAFSDMWFTIRESWIEPGDTDSSAIGQLTLGAGITITGADSSQITVPRSITALMSRNSYDADLQVKTINGDRQYVAASGILRKRPTAKAPT